MILWFPPLLRPVLLPLVLLNTHIHELCHALAGVFTGGTVQKIEVLGDGSGLTPIVGGNVYLVAMAGYVGSALVGGFLIASSRSKTTSRTAISVLGLLLIVSSVLWVRSDWVGVVSGWTLGISLLLFATRASESSLVWLAPFLGIQQCLTSLYSLFVLMKITTGTDLQNDAKLLESATGVSSWIWAGLWSALSILFIAFAFRKVIKPEPTGT